MLRFLNVAEKEGFEPPIPLRVCRISSAVLSTTQPLLRSMVGRRWRGALDNGGLSTLQGQFARELGAASTTVRPLVGNRVPMRSFGPDFRPCSRLSIARQG